MEQKIIGFGMDAIVGNKDVAGQRNRTIQLPNGRNEEDFKAFSTREILKSIANENRMKGNIVSEMESTDNKNYNVKNIGQAIELAVGKLLGDQVRDIQFLHSENSRLANPGLGWPKCKPCNSAPSFSTMSFYSFSIKFHYEKIRIMTSGSLSFAETNSAFSMEVQIDRADFSVSAWHNAFNPPVPFNIECRNGFQYLDYWAFMFSTSDSVTSEEAGKKGVVLLKDEIDDTFNYRPAGHAELQKDSLFLSEKLEAEINSGVTEKISDLVWRWQE